MRRSKTTTEKKQQKKSKNEIKQVINIKHNKRKENKRKKTDKKQWIKQITEKKTVKYNNIMYICICKDVCNIFVVNMPNPCCEYSDSE